MAPAVRQTADERRATVLDAARSHFAEHGLHGTSTDAIARDAGISQPYLFRLFHTKKELYLATVEACLAQTLEAFEEAAAGLTGEEAMRAMGRRYVELLDDRRMLKAQLQAYASCDDPEVRDAVRTGYGRLFQYVERVSGAPTEAVVDFFAKGMLLNVFSALDLQHADEPWAQRMVEGCIGGKDD